MVEQLQSFSVWPAVAAEYSANIDCSASKLSSGLIVTCLFMFWQRQHGRPPGWWLHIKTTNRWGNEFASQLKGEQRGGDFPPIRRLHTNKLWTFGEVLVLVRCFAPKQSLNLHFGVCQNSREIPSMAAALPGIVGRDLRPPGRPDVNGCEFGRI